MLGHATLLFWRDSWGCGWNAVNTWGERFLWAVEWELGRRGGEQVSQGAPKSSRFTQRAGANDLHKVVAGSPKVDLVGVPLKRTQSNLSLFIHESTVVQI